MRKFVLVAAAWSLTAMIVQAQESRLLTRPSLPRDDALARLGLRQRWFAYVPVAGQRDGLCNVQAFENQVVAHAASGMVTCLDANTGTTQWQIRIGRSNEGRRVPVAANKSIFLINAGPTLYGIDRRTGIVEFEFPTDGLLATPPALDENYAYVCNGSGRVQAFILPVLNATAASERTGTAGAAGLDVYGKPQLTRRVQSIWSYAADSPSSQPPIILSTHVVLVGRDGALETFMKDNDVIVDRFYVKGGVGGQVAAIGNHLYVPGKDSNLYHFQVDQGALRLQWRHFAGTELTTRPYVVDGDVYVQGQDGSLSCIDRISGALRWRTAAGEQFLARTNRLVVVATANGRVACLDRQTGGVVNTWDGSQFAFRVANEWTDRIYLANHDGLVLCLQDRDKSHNQVVIHNRPPQQPKKTGAANGDVATGGGGATEARNNP